MENVTEPDLAICSECNTALSEGQDRETTPEGVFCRPCFNNLTAQLQQIVAAQSEGINYGMAAVGGVLGAAVGVLVWWGFTVVTKIAFGLVAIVIGFAAGKGVVMFSGGKRSQGLQITSVIISALGFVYANYLVNRTFIQNAYAEQGQALLLPWLPTPDVLFGVLRVGFSVMDIVFLAIVVYQAWKIPEPNRLEV